jgi:hypothetical protein
MPDTNYPPFESGALAIPRQLNRWLDKNPQGGPLRRVDTYIILPVFSAIDSWNGYSDIVTSFNFETQNNFSLKSGYTVPTNPNYVLCVSYRVGNIVTRYMLWDATGSEMNRDIPMYTGQPLKKNFRFEVWNTSQGAASQSTALTFYTSKLGSIDYRFGADYALATNDGQVTNFNAAITTAGNIVVSGAGTSGANGLYTVRINNQWINSTGEYLIIRASVPPTGYWTWRILVYANNHTLYTAIHTNAAIDSITWSLSAYGDSPAPTTNQTATADFLVPMTFPTNAVSTTN